MNGKVKKVFKDRGFGFIKPDGDGADIFFHVRGCGAGVFDALNEGSSVEYDVDSVDNRGKGPRATNVKRGVDSNPAS